mmetsp:Transcript_1981/g.4042  ORF Transcript_1981/g.4042 Transcript_1981/m.4042 type:complete len:210 (+) Transcript_1981:2-631(+)
MGGGMGGGMGGMGNSFFQFEGPGDDFGFGGLDGLGGRRRQGPRPIKRELPVTLEDLYTGASKKFRVATEHGQTKELTVNVKPGWKAGTKITFDGEASGLGPSAPPVVFQITQKPHPRFSREGDDLHTSMRVPLKDALIGLHSSVVGLNQETVPVDVKNVIRPGVCKRIKGKGMPKSKSPGEYGDLVVKFDVDFPTTLSDEQRSGLSRLL